MSTCKGKIHSLESFGSVDGPGVRYLIFLKGCTMRCEFCHNPDTWAGTGGFLATPEELLDRAERYHSYWGDQGGITVSGGEPLLQLPFLRELFAQAKSRGISTCLDTAGGPYTKEDPFHQEFLALLKDTDLVMLDIKHIDSREHKRLTGIGNEGILEMARELSALGQPMWIRHVLVPERNDRDEYLVALREFLDTLHNVERVEVLPYHTLGIYKWKELGLPYSLEGILPPSKERIENAEKILGCHKS